MTPSTRERRSGDRMDMTTEPLLTVKDLSVAFRQGGRETLAVDRISFSVKKGETLALVGLVRAEFLRGRNFEYIQAARALGVSNAVIMFRHLLPNAMVATMTFLPFIVSSSVMTLTALDFLGFGLPPGSPSLGELLSQAKANVQAPWLGFTGFFSVAIMLSLLIFIGEAARDAFDPRKTFR